MGHKHGIENVRNRKSTGKQEADKITSEEIPKTDSKDMTQVNRYNSRKKGCILPKEVGAEDSNVKGIWKSKMKGRSKWQYIVL